MRFLLAFLLSLSLLTPSLSRAETLNRPLFIGERGEDVSFLQAFLQAGGYFTYPSITGLFGSFTWKAVAAFQSANGLESVGVVGPLTRALINAGGMSMSGSAARPVQPAQASSTASTTATTPSFSVSTTSIPTFCPFVFCPTGNYTPGFGGGGTAVSNTTVSDPDGMPTNATLQAMLTGTTGNHDAVPHGVPNSYDWYAHGRMGEGVTPTGGKSYLEPWGEVYLADGQTIDSDDVLEVSNLRLYLKSASTGLWTEVKDQLRVNGGLYNEDYTGSSIAVTPYSVSPNALLFKLTSGRVFHFFSSSRYPVADVSDLAAAIVSFDTRILSASGADVTSRNTKYIAGTGLDWWSASSGGTNNDAFVGQLSYVTPQNRKKYGTTLTTLSSLQAVRPPSNLEQLSDTYTPGIDPHYVAGAFAQYMARSGSTVDDARTQIYKNFYDTLAAESGLLDNLNAIYILASADGTLALQNLVSDSLNASSTATFTANAGIAGDGVSTYVDTNFNPAVTTNHFTQNNAYVGVWLNSSGQNSTTPVGWYDGSDGVTINPRTPANEISVRLNQAASTVSSTGGSFTDGRGYVSAIRDGASSIRIRKSGSTIKTDTTVSTAVNSATFGVDKVGGSGLYSSAQVRLVVIGAALTDQQDTVLANAASTMFTALDAL